ncbi:hypothetical protein OH76DRAFT_1411834 [Lentinus brumalis]|uniref:Uncharacterized protein n=1 Tax=Lentinus brumalis TaxID=2498619 RepID=A0A371CN84_9APHY|nr:hypothetical protein OH76DRAFT_1411834 [Polyporus brumalis]
MPSIHNIAPTLDISLSGSLSVHAIPEASLVFDLLPSTPVHVNARAYIALDGSVTVSFEADLSSVEARVVAAIDANAGVEASAGSSSKFTLGPISLYRNSFTLYEQSISLGGNQRRDHPLDDLIEDGIFAGSAYQTTSSNTSITSFDHRLDERSLIGGALTCPQATDGGSTACDKELADDDPAHADPDDTSDELSERSLDFEDLVDAEERVKVIGCPGLEIKPPSL